MGSRYKQDRWYWPTFGNIADAEQASNQGVWAAAFCAVVTAVVATISLLSSHSVMGINSLAYVDAVLLVIIAWRIRRRSRVFAVIGLALFVAEKIFQFATQPQAYFGILMAVALLFCFINGVRCTFAYHRMLAAKAQEPAVANA